MQCNNANLLSKAKCINIVNELIIENEIILYIKNKVFE